VADHVVPLQDLVEHDPVEELAQADAEQNTANRDPLAPHDLVHPLHQSSVASRTCRWTQRGRCHSSATATAPA
jgi:hypothetical protein